MKLNRWLVLALALISGVLLTMLFSRRADTAAYYQGITRPLVIAHQGGDGLWPGNTMYAFEHANELGVDVLEMDIHITKDGQLVIMHDETVDRTTDGTGEIESMTLSELKQLDTGYGWSLDEGETFPYRGQGITVPTLEEVFQAFPGKRMTVEIKKTNASIIKPFCKLIRKYKMQDKVLVASFYDDRMREFRKNCPEVATSSARRETTAFVLFTKGYLGRLNSPRFNSLQVPEESGGITVMTEAFVRAAHERGLAVEPWTINDPEQMRKYIQWGVDGIITDRPDLMLEILGRRK